jgi:hypothetical protein
MLNLGIVMAICCIPLVLTASYNGVATWGGEDFYVLNIEIVSS